MNSHSAKWMIADSESICRREYEIALHTNLSSPIGTIYGFKTPDKILQKV